jgi:hypothetical protein
METSDYQAYLLRLWKIKSDGGKWRAQLVRVDTGEKVGFPSLEALIQYLQNLDHSENPTLEALIKPKNETTIIKGRKEGEEH